MLHFCLFVWVCFLLGLGRLLRALLQLQLEVLLDIRELLQPEPEDLADRTSSLIEKAQNIRKLTKLR